MSEPGQDDVQTPDAVALDVWAPDRRLFAALRIDRRLAGQAAAIIVTDGEAVSADGADVELGDGTARVDMDGVLLELELRAVAPPATAGAAGLRRTAQLCEIEGTITRDGKSAPLRGQGVHARSWGDLAGAARRRYVTAATEEGSVLHLVALRPAGATAHGDEIVTGQIADPRSENGAVPFEDVRLSTIYGADGLPRSAGAELYRPGEEFPSRLSGEAVSGSVLGMGDTRIAISFFRWTLVDRAGWGTYEIEPSP